MHAQIIAIRSLKQFASKIIGLEVGRKSHWCQCRMKRVFFFWKGEAWRDRRRIVPVRVTSLSSRGHQYFAIANKIGGCTYLGTNKHHTFLQATCRKQNAEIRQAKCRLLKKAGLQLPGKLSFQSCFKTLHWLHKGFACVGAWNGAKPCILYFYF